jgi:hypothetical protein
MRPSRIFDWQLDHQGTLIAVQKGLRLWANSLTHIRFL